MQAILLKDVEGLGSAGAVVNVSRGYMRNFLQPRQLAELARPALIAEVQRREERRKAAEARAVEQAHELAALLGRTILTLKAKAGDDGRLFGSITAGDVASYDFRDPAHGGATTSTGAPKIPGAQVFPGFQPANEVDRNRNNIGVYAGLESEIVQGLNLDVSGLAVMRDAAADQALGQAGKWARGSIGEAHAPRLGIVAHERR